MNKEKVTRERRLQSWHCVSVGASTWVHGMSERDAEVCGVSVCPRPFFLGEGLLSYNGNTIALAKNSLWGECGVIWMCVVCGFRYRAGAGTFFYELSFFFSPSCTKLARCAVEQVDVVVILSLGSGLCVSQDHAESASMNKKQG